MSVNDKVVHARLLISLIKEELSSKENTNDTLFSSLVYKGVGPTNKAILSSGGWIDKIFKLVTFNNLNETNSAMLSIILECYVDILELIVDNISILSYDKEITSLLMSTNAISKHFINECKSSGLSIDEHGMTMVSVSSNIDEKFLYTDSKNKSSEHLIVKKLTANRARIRDFISRYSADEIFSSVKNEYANNFNELKSQYNVMMKNLDSSFKSIEELNPKVDSMVSKSLISWSKKNDALIEELTVSVSQARERKDEVDDFCQEAMSRVCSILKKAQQQGMAASFQQRHSDLKWPQIIWGIVFILSLVGLFSLGWYLIEYVFSSSGKSWVEIVSKFSLSLPLIWVTWFAAKQYNHTVQLREDYAYKVAVAMAYHGYKEELDGTNNEMGQKLLENIILHFADNPVRLYKNDSSVSILDSFIKNNNFADIITAIRGKESK